MENIFKSLLLIGLLLVSWVLVLLAHGMLKEDENLGPRLTLPHSKLIGWMFIISIVILSGGVVMKVISLWWV